MNKLFTVVILFAGLTVFSAGGVATTLQEAAMIANAAERGSDGAQVLLAVIYMRGDAGYPKDDRLAVHWLELAAEQSNAYAEKMLGDFYEQGRGVPKNLKVAADWREKAANRGNVQAQTSLGKMYLSGTGVPHDNEKAEHWLNRAAAEGDSEAQYLLGKMYKSGYGVAKNEATGNNWLAKSAAQGYDDAVKLVHFMEDFGFVAEEKYYTRTPAIDKLAADGDTEAQYQLAIRYESGTYGYQQNAEKALYWFKMSANAGHLLAIKSLVDIYGKGIPGIKADPELAQYWRDKAAQIK
jgi:hypothetical protein